MDSLAAAHHNGVGLTQSVRRLSVVSTNMGKVLLYPLFLTGQPPSWGAASLSSNPVHVAFLSCVCWRSGCAGAKRAFAAFPFDPGNCGFFVYLACRSLCEVGVTWDRGCAPVTRVSKFFFCSLPQNAVLILWPRRTPIVLVLHSRFVACPWC